MTLPIPSLDDRRFEDLVEEAGKLIPVYAPRWTDHNIHDPGITVIDLAAWLTETAIYRLNLVTEERKLKYLEIMGVTPKPPGRAELDLSFDAAGTVKVEKGTPFYTTIREERIYFEIQEEITVVPARLEKVIADKCVGVGFDRSQRNEMAGAYFHPFGRETKKGSAIYLGFDRPDETVSFTCYLYEKDLVPKGTCGNEPDYKYKNSKLKWQYTVTQPVEPGAEDPSAEPVTRIGWREIEPQYDGTEGFKKSGRIIFKEIEEWKTAKIPIHSGEDHFCWLRCVVEKSYFEYPPRIESIRINTVTARHGLTVRNEQKQQEGTGYPHQEFKLDHSPVCRNPKVTVTKKKTKKDGDEWVKEEWSQVENFDAAGPGHRYYTLDYEAGKIHFGDGLKGSIPPAEAVIAVTPYIAAGGEKGNLAANCDWRSDAITGIIINNHNPAAGGTAAETVEEALIRCRKGLKRPYTAVTNEDLEYYAKHTPGLRIAKAKAIPHYMQTPASP
ncbi:MAG: hypothetical protein GY757_13425, partial [bacterium]|nr:hypothetical protein [bacterium]